MAATHSAVVEEAQGGGRLQREGQNLLEVQRGLHDGGLPQQREGPCPAQAAWRAEETFCRVGRWKLGNPTQAWQSHSLAAPTLRSVTPRRAQVGAVCTHFPCWLRSSGAGPPLRAFPSGWFSLPPSPASLPQRPVGALQTQESLGPLCRLPAGRTGTLSPKSLATALFPGTAFPLDIQRVVIIPGRTESTE